MENEKKTVFLSRSKEVYRIPSLFYDGERKMLMAFAERRSIAADTHTEALVMKTGIKKKDETTDKDTIGWSDAMVLQEAKISEHRPMNPCPVYEKSTKVLFLFFICIEGNISDHSQVRSGCNKTRLCYIKTTDGGQTWSEVTDLTDSLIKDKNWATFAVGPGHGIQTEAGRMIVPLYAYMNHKSYALCLYSDDKGDTWQFSGMIQGNSGECEIAEVYNDQGVSSIYCNARSNKGCRVEAFSSDNGNDFCMLESAKKLLETRTGCQGSVVSFPAQDDAPDKESGENSTLNKWLLYTHPANTSKRLDLGVYLNKSPHDPKAWSKPWIINSGPSGYSDLAYIDDGWFVCLMECGHKCETEQIGYKLFSYSEIKAGIGE
ncbi:sialidase-3-like isoform 1-T2 [Pholidichthys leucotaenia]